MLLCCYYVTASGPSHCKHDYMAPFLCCTLQIITKTKRLWIKQYLIVCNEVKHTPPNEQRNPVMYVHSFKDACMKNMKAIFISMMFTLSTAKWNFVATDASIVPENIHMINPKKASGHPKGDVHGVKTRSFREIEGFKPKKKQLTPFSLKVSDTHCTQFCNRAIHFWSYLNLKE